jgi:hypothetical protein
MILLIDSFLASVHFSVALCRGTMISLNLAGFLEYLAVTSWTFQALLVQATICTTQLQLCQDLVPAARTSHQLPRAGILSCKMNPTGKGLLTTSALIDGATQRSLRRQRNKAELFLDPRPGRPEHVMDVMESGACN